ncbi:hypothetical protein BV22DRAFT_1036562, partial [Leucogyrophana mollusca]
MPRCQVGWYLVALTLLAVDFRVATHSTPINGGVETPPQNELSSLNLYPTLMEALSTYLGARK